jgi:hypothetical protein
MPKIALSLVIQPYQAEVFVNLKGLDGIDQRMVAVIDTGADTCLFPRHLLPLLDYQQISDEIIIEQAGIAQQQFSATEALVNIFLEDYQGNQSTLFEVRALFADTSIALIGFDGVLDRATLYIDYRSRNEGWIEID